MNHITLRKGIKFFNEGRFHEAHETSKCHWLHMDDSIEKRFLQGMLKVASALNKYEKKNYSGTGKLIESGSRFLRDNESAEFQIDKKAFLKQVYHIRDTFTASRSISKGDYPKITIA